MDLSTSPGGAAVDASGSACAGVTSKALLQLSWFDQLKQKVNRVWGNLASRESLVINKNLGIAQPPLQIQASSGALPDIRGGLKHVPRVRL